MSDDPIFKKPPVFLSAIDAAVAATAKPSEKRPEEPFKIVFRIVNHRIDYVMQGLGAMAPSWMLHFIKDGLDRFAVKRVSYKPTLETLSTGARIRMEHVIEFDWEKEEIATSMPPEDGDEFMGVINFVGTVLQQMDQRTKSAPIGDA